MKKKSLFLLPILGLCLTSCNKTQHYSYSNYIKNLEWKNDDFRVLVLGDVHFGLTDNFEKHMQFMDLTINDQNSKPNLIILNGDSFTFADKVIVDKLFTFIDNHNIPWTFVFGNHDDQGFYPDTYIQTILGENSKYRNVNFVNLIDDDIDGRSNFVINLVKSNNLKYQLYFFDSHSYNYADGEYDYIKQSQIDWYKGMIEYTNKNINDNWMIGQDTIKSSMFMHIPLPEYREAMADIENTKIIGSNDEGCGAPKYNSGLFQAILDFKSTQSVTASHDHNNDAVMLYKDVYLTYSVHATDRVYMHDNHLGGQLLIIKDDSSIEFRNIYHGYDEL